MAKRYSIIELGIKGKELLGLDTLSDNEKKGLEIRNAIYVYRNSRTSRVYIGQTCGDFK